MGAFTERSIRIPDSVVPHSLIVVTYDNAAQPVHEGELVALSDVGTYVLERFLLLEALPGEVLQKRIAIHDSVGNLTLVRRPDAGQNAVMDKGKVFGYSMRVAVRFVDSARGRYSEMKDDGDAVSMEFMGYFPGGREGGKGETPFLD